MSIFRNLNPDSKQALSILAILAVGAVLAGSLGYAFVWLLL